MARDPLEINQYLCWDPKTPDRYFFRILSSCVKSVTLITSRDVRFSRLTEEDFREENVYEQEAPYVVYFKAGVWLMGRLIHTNPHSEHVTIHISGKRFNTKHKKNIERVRKLSVLVFTGELNAQQRVDVVEPEPEPEPEQTSLVQVVNTTPPENPNPNPNPPYSQQYHTRSSNIYSPYVRFMFTEMLKYLNLCATRADFDAWFMSRYIEKQRKPHLAIYNIPDFVSVDEALHYFYIFALDNPEEYREMYIAHTNNGF